MRTLIVLPVEGGSGETITALHVAERLADSGGTVGFLASSFARRFITPRLSEHLWSLGSIGAENQAQWDRALAAFRPDIVLFADYPLMFFPRGSAPLAREPGWVESLASVDALLVTLDHFGFSRGQTERRFFAGPPHLGFFAYYEIPAIPPEMRVLLPCPMHEPGPVADRAGQPFRYWDVPLTMPFSARDAVRRKYSVRPNEKLVFHSVPNWAVKAAGQLRLPFYQYYPELLDVYFADFDAPVVIVSVNDGSLLHTSPGSSVRIVSLGPVPQSDFEALLLAADLVITENKLSISMGKAVCGLQPCAVLTNSARLLELIDNANERVRAILLAMESVRLGSVYQFAVFPSVTPQDIETIGLYQDNRLANAFRELEVFGGDETRDALRRLLFDSAERDALRSRQESYVDGVGLLPDCVQALYNLRDGARS